MRKAKVAKMLTAFLSALMVFSAICAPPGANAADDNAIQAVARSYDFCGTWNWGYAYDYLLDEAKATPDSMDVAYVGMGEEERESLRGEPGKWRKYWLRIEISPATDPREISFPMSQWYAMTEPTIKQIQTLAVFNVRIRNSGEVRFYPKDEMLMSADYYRIYYDYDDTDRLENESMYRALSRDPVDAYWVPKKESGSNEWLLEVVGYVGGMTEREIESAMGEMEIVFDAALATTDAVIETRDHLVRIDDVRREVRYQEDGVKVKMNFFVRCNLDLVGYYELFPPSFIGADTEAVVADVMLHPEEYQLFEYWLIADKEMPWGICNMRIFLRDPPENLWFDMDGWYDFQCDLWTNGTYELNWLGTSFLMKTEGKTDDEIAAVLKNTKLIIEFSTEFAGENLWVGYPHVGYPGVRFAVEVDMSSVRTHEQVLETLRDCDG